jgi:hypothetical protein
MNMIKSPQFLREYIALMNEVVSHAECARRLGLQRTTPHVWLRLSKQAAERKDDPSEWIIEIDGIKQWFHKWCSQARVSAISEGADNAIVRFRDGIWKERSFQGHVCHKFNPDFLDLGMRNLLGLTEEDQYLKDKNGNLIPEMEHVHPPGDFTAFMLGAWQPKRYGKKSSVDVNMNARVSGGVMIVGGQRSAQVAAPLPVLEIVQQAEEPEPDFLTVTDTDPDAPPAPAVMDDEDEPAPVSSPSPTPTPSPVVDPLEYRPGPNPAVVKGGNRPLTAEEKAALSRIKS